MRLTLPALLFSLLLAACDGGTPAPTQVTVEVSDPDFGDTFSYQTTTDFRPALSPQSGYPQSAAEAAMLNAVNAERSRGGTCPDGRTFPARSALTFEGHLHESADRYAGVLAGRGTLELPHRIGTSTPARRMVEAGFKPAPPTGTVLRFEESLAAGMTDPAEVIAAWKGSVSHCAALYSPVPYGSVARADGAGLAYWVLNTAGW
ncbi:CAP domain-containing protein [Deinococcus sp. NW-56]|uniref:CAP domain-containing protein n=1 Tax=Deinococcus sp. NW-56 TaxID=2080419 RepID=UPI000CF42604|nr:CAP domain-containing protein [Deinococcus sp. NW-56]